MIRKLAFALTLISMGIASSVHALGLGEVTVSSSLNQPLRAEIELVSVKGLGVEEILPGLATREEFRRAGVDRVYFLSDLRFEVEKNAEGKAVVVLTTNKPVREPFLNFLVEVIWPSGRLLREYALLIDPPLFTEEPARPVAAPSASAPAPAVQAPSAPVERGDRVAVPSQATAPASVSGTYGPTNRRDTLWDIAIKARPNRSVSPQQVMLAIQDLNPGAFIGGNINKLKAGQILRLPDMGQIKQRSAASAINEVIAQNEMAQGKKRKTVTSAAKATKPAAPAAAPASGDELKLVVPESNSDSSSSTANAGDSAQSGSGRGAETELAVTLEKLDKSNLERDELSGKVQDLEEQLATLQRLLTLKNDQLATMQAEARQAELEQAKAEQDSVAEAAQTEQSVASTGSELAADEMQSAAVEETVVDETVVDETVVDETAAAETQKPEDAKAKAAEAPAKEATKPVASEPAPAEATGNIFDLVLNNPLYQAFVAAGLILLLIILWLVSRNNAKREEQVLESSEQISDADNFDEDYEEAEEADTFGEEVDASDDEVETVASEGSENEEGSESESEDIIAEADVYIAYGRLDQAASVLEQGISADPIRTDYRLKLLEVYAETNDADAFDKQLSELEAIQDPEAMESALEIKAGMAGGDADALEYEPEPVDGSSLEQEPEQEPEEFTPEFEEQGFDADEVEPLEEASLLAEEEPDNSFDFERVESDLDDDDLGVDLSSEDLELDLDIDLEAEGESSLDVGELALEDNEVVEEVPDVSEDDALDISPFEEAGSEKEPEEELLDLVDTGLELAPEGGDEPDADDVVEGLDLELADLELSEELEAESEIDIPDDLSIPDEMLDIEPDSELDTAVESGDAGEPELDSAEFEAAEAEGLALESEPDLEESDLVDADTLSLDDDLDAPVSDSDAVVSDDILEEAEEALGTGEDLEADLTEDDDFDFLNGTDEASTKLDLARAYIDMGDVEGAKDILQEVEKEGSEEQQADARSLLDSLGE